MPICGPNFLLKPIISSGCEFTLIQNHWSRQSEIRQPFHWNCIFSSIFFSFLIILLVRFTLFLIYLIFLSNVISPPTFFPVASSKVFTFLLFNLLRHFRSYQKKVLNKNTGIRYSPSGIRLCHIRGDISDSSFLSTIISMLYEMAKFNEPETKWWITAIISLVS